MCKRRGSLPLNLESPMPVHQSKVKVSTKWLLTKLTLSLSLWFVTCNCTQDAGLLTSWMSPLSSFFLFFRPSIGSRSCDTNDSSLPQLILISVAWSNQESKSTAHIFNCYYYFLHGILISTIRKVSVKVRQLLPRKIQWQPIALLYIYIYIYIYI